MCNYECWWVRVLYACSSVKLKPIRCLAKESKNVWRFPKMVVPKIMASHTKYWLNDLWMIWGTPMNLKTYIFVGSSNVSLACLKPIRTSQSVQSVFLPRFGMLWAVNPSIQGSTYLNMSHTDISPAKSCSFLGRRSTWGSLILTTRGEQRVERNLTNRKPNTWTHCMFNNAWTWHMHNSGGAVL